MKKIFQIAIKDIVQTMQAPLGFLIPLAMYLLFTGILGAAFGGIGVKDTKLPIGLIAEYLGNMHRRHWAIHNGVDAVQLDANGATDGW